MGILTGSYLDYIDGTPGGFLVVDNLNLYVSQSTYITEDLYVSGTIYGTTTTASYVNPLSQSVLISGSLIVNGPISASILNVSIITSSISSYSGSTVFGSSSLDTHRFTGSILTTGSVYVTGSIYTNGNLFGTSSYALNALSSSYSLSSSYATTASYALNAIGANTTGSFTGSFTGSILSPNIQLSNGLHISQNFVTQSIVLNGATGIILSNPINYHTSFINYVAFDVNYGGTFWQAGSLILTNDGFTTGLYSASAKPISSPPGPILTFSGSLGGTMLLHATVAGMNTACDFILDVKALL
jgi:hypothetical protein